MKSSLEHQKVIVNSTGNLLVNNSTVLFSFTRERIRNNKLVILERSTTDTRCNFLSGPVEHGVKSWTGASRIGVLGRVGQPRIRRHVRGIDFPYRSPNFYHSIGDESFASRQKWNEDKGEEERKIDQSQLRFRLRFGATLPSLLRSSNGKVFSRWRGFLWNATTGQTEALNEIRVYSVLVLPLVNFSKNFSSSLIFAGSLPSFPFIRNEII